MKTTNNQNKYEMEETNNFNNECEDDFFDYGDSYDPMDDYDWRAESWDAMTDGMYGDMPEGFDGDYDWLGY